MSETKLIAEMASKISTELFDAFKWKCKIIEDVSWECITPEEHAGKKDHPSDCVFYYRDPYDNQMKYVNTDLKSYAKGSINKVQIRKAIHSLSYATNCAAYNPHWKNLFKPEDPHTVKGMLFVYNHCQSYNGDFDSIIKNLNIFSKDEPKVNHLEGNSQIYILSPERIVELNSIVNDIQVMKGRELLPSSDQYCFFHPNETINKNHTIHDYSEPATLEVLMSPWIIVKHAATRKTESGYVVYYLKEGDEVDEFIYLLDALSYFQILNDKGSVRVKLVKNNTYGSLNFKEAVSVYFGNLGYDNERIEEQQKKLSVETINKVVPQFSSVELGVIG
ncbi:hypothetical protein NTK89_001652 [Vibrio fluvialis]|nr:hypothetical protein [Vibrio fluvialis]